jgi:hypothetical protein
LGTERHRSQRAELLVQVECEADKAYCLGRCENISDTGLLVRTPETFEPSTIVLVRFALPPPTAIRIETKGTVVRVRRGESMAIQFLDIKDRYRIGIVDFIEHASKEEELAKSVARGGL